jgi:allantoate deiminase
LTEIDRLQKRIDDLAKIGGNGTSVTRLGLSREEHQARNLVADWCRGVGATVRRDAAGNLFARFSGERDTDPCVLVGSHIDSVPEGGRFDGALGVCCAAEALVSLKDAGVRFQRPVELVAWADEEGARFGIGLYGSTAAFGKLPAGAAELKDKNGTSIGDALRALGETGDPDKAARDPQQVKAYLELHIEQGPRLERAGLALGVVTDIVGIFHARIRVKGRADHAGATVMGARKDALVAATQLIAALERIASAVPDAVGTVGEISVRPGAKNVVPGECVFSLDIRAPREESIVRVQSELQAEMARVMRARDVEITADRINRVPVTPLDQRIRATLVDAVRMAARIDPPLMVSGAGHDAQIPSLAGVPTGMIFVRSTGGSHTPTELAATADAGLGTDALARAIKELATT